ncbi:cytochrome P450 [Sistotremastrum niveocremeum HHB9708]|uniref:Cytochrome P450 n=1 Tax=Sistotremastrum niveocremeum HHB9708 TaxID=1314777 RepID=A0A164ZVZ6_9AGAM|nr:cytochrome P450 [Sistotremastrum niveocremeum HHB9708]
MPFYSASVSDALAYLLPALITVILVHQLSRLAKTKSRNPLGLPLPAGPKGLPLLGNIHQVPVKDSWLKFTEWGGIYGEVIGLTLLGKNVIVLNSYKAADDLLNKRGAIYSGRSPAPLMADYGGWYYNMVFVPMGDFMHGQRRILNHFFNASAVRKYSEVLTEKARSLARFTYSKPERFQGFNRLHVTATVLKIAYGFKVTSEDDPIMKEAEASITSGSFLGTPGTHPIDLFPILGKLPFWIWGRKFADGVKAMQQGAYNVGLKPFRFVKQQTAAGVAPPSMASELIESHSLPDGTIKDEEIIWAAIAHLYFAGSDTTVSAVDTFALAMMLHPQIQRKAQQELDDLLRGERLPDLSDRESLPYLEAVLREILRWKPVTPLGIPHRLDQDDIYNDTFLPAGSMVLYNAYAMSFDPKQFPDPFTFNPDRFLTDSQGSVSLRADVLNPEDIAFGFGRRKCPGRHLASEALWINMATILTVFDIRLIKDQSGNDILPDMDYHTHLVSHPKPYKGDFVSRSSSALELLGVLQIGS